MSDPKDRVLWHQSGVAPTGEPFVQLLLDDKIIVQMSTAQARDHARSILEAAEAAEQDAFIVTFGRDEIGLAPQDAGKILMALRDFRARLTGKSQGPTSPRDWVMPPADKMPDYGPGWKKPSIDDYTKNPKKKGPNDQP